MTAATTYRPDVDGLRAVSVLAVFAFHLSPGALPGGFLGVDVFFVISGFVITTLLVRELAAGPSLADLAARFYRRRVLRIMPLYVAVVLACLAVGWLVLLPVDLARVVRAAAAGTQLHANLWFADSVGYFEPIAELEVLLHTWSLSIEEQFYLIWPVALAVLTRGTSPRVRLGIVVGVTALLIALSHALAGTGTERTAYFLLRARAYEPLLGCCLALALAGRPAPTGALAIVVSALGLGGLAASFALLDASADLPGLTALVPTASTLLVLYAGAPILATAPAVAIGRISYSLYLVHWPILVFARYLGVAVEGVAAVAVVAATFGLAALTHRFVEERFRYRAWRLRTALAVFAVAPALALAALHYTAWRTDDFDLRLTADARARMATQRQLAHELRAVCHGAPLPAAHCTLGAPAVPTAALWGDSHANHYAGLFDVLGTHRGIALRELTANACPPLVGGELPAGCADRNRAALAVLVADRRLDTVYLAAAWSKQRGLVPALLRTVVELRAAGKRVVLVREMPELPLEQLDCPVRAAQLAWVSRSCAFADPRAVRDRDLELAVAAAALETLDPPALVCDGTRCQQELEGVPLYRLGDRGHLNMAGSRALGMALR